ncbi:MAG: hypothetical protein PHQ34_11650 [Methanothrix sp.]|nr:hypothetical protein [Methanothrix sp.]
MQGRLISLLLMISLATAVISAVASLDQLPEDAVRSNSSYNSTAISFVSENRISSAPVVLMPGSGYYSSHPFVIGGAIGSRTVLSNGDFAAGTSMSHEVGFASNLSGRREYSASSRSTHSEYEDSSYTTTAMKIDESVASGKVEIGVLSGGEGNAWKNPAIEIEEEYVGTYHITKNYTINNSFSNARAFDGWLYCCGAIGAGYGITPPRLSLISADDVFTCKRC